MAQLLVDSVGRRVRKLRISLTDACNLRCTYCMPLNASFMPESRYLSAAQISGVVSELCDLGLEEVRLTGGEPLLRRNFADITKALSTLPLKKRGLTTNAVVLGLHLPQLWEHGVHHLNISLDSLHEDRFQAISHGRNLGRILKNIEAAVSMGFHVKINVVAMKGVNDDEVLDFIELSKSWSVEVRFLELMRIGVACATQKQQFISADELLEKIKSKYAVKSSFVKSDSTSFNFVTDCGAKFGFIASESKAFCGQCSRWRLSADGIMRACLFKEDGLNIKQTTEAERRQIYFQLLGMKPILRSESVLHQMNTIGG